MKIQTLKNLNRKLTFNTIATAATAIAKAQKTLVRFHMGPEAHRQVFVAGPRKPLATLNWEWSRSTGGILAKAASQKRKVKAVKVAAAV